MQLVGVMDSGVGGLTVLSELIGVAPSANYLYLADQAFCPYGTKTFQQIRSRVLSVAQWLKLNGATSIVVACNTASVFATEIQHSLQLPVWEIIAPTCEATLKVTKNRRVALLATKATVESKVYQTRLQKSGVFVVEYPCGPMVELVENGAQGDIRQACVQQCLEGLSADHCDTVILGCTHFPFLVKEIATEVGKKTLVSCSKAMAQNFACINGNGKISLCSTAPSPVANATAKEFHFPNFQFVKVQ